MEKIHVLPVIDGGQPLEGGPVPLGGHPGVGVGLRGPVGLPQGGVDVGAEHGVGQLAEEELDEGGDGMDVLHQPVLDVEVRGRRAEVVEGPGIGMK